MTVLDLKPGDIFECENRTYIKTDWRLKCVDLSTGEVRDFYGQNTIKIFKKTIDKEHIVCYHIITKRKKEILKL